MGIASTVSALFGWYIHSDSIHSDSTVLCDTCRQKGSSQTKHNLLSCVLYNAGLINIGLLCDGHVRVVYTSKPFYSVIRLL